MSQEAFKKANLLDRKERAEKIELEASKLTKLILEESNSEEIFNELFAQISRIILDEVAKR